MASEGGHRLPPLVLKWRARSPDPRLMKIAITGASGLVGGALRSALSQDGHELVRLVRHAPRGPDELRWDVRAGELAPDELADVDALIHLAGENIAGGRWSEERKRRIRQSRADGTALVAKALAALSPDRRPATLISASAVGYYGDRGDEVLSEESAPGEDFLAEVCQVWEAAAEPARAAGVRVVHPRLGVVLAAEGGALEKMRLPFSLGAGGPTGDGSQFMSWVHLADVVGIVRFALAHETLAGPINAVAPKAPRNREFTTALGRAMHRPALIPTPTFALRALFGEMADATLLASQNCVPAVLLREGYTWKYPELEGALASIFD